MTKKILILIYLNFCLSPFKPDAQSPTEFPIKTIAQLQDTINNILTTEHQSAIMLAVVTKDTILFSNGFGIANIDTKQKATSFSNNEISKTGETITRCRPFQNYS